MEEARRQIITLTDIEVEYWWSASVLTFANLDRGYPHAASCCQHEKPLACVINRRVMSWEDGTLDGASTHQPVISHARQVLRSSSDTSRRFLYNTAVDKSDAIAFDCRARISGLCHTRRHKQPRACMRDDAPAPSSNERTSGSGSTCSAFATTRSPYAP
jgi:hypothetical protein